MRLIHRDERHPEPRGKPDEARVCQTLRRNVHEVVPACHRPRHHDLLLARRQAGVEIRSPDSRVLEGTHLIAHERDERGHHDGETRQHRCGNLIAHGLARTRRHHRKRVAPRKDCLDDLSLTWTKARVAKVALERCAGICYIGHATPPTTRRPAAPAAYSRSYRP